MIDPEAPDDEVPPDATEELSTKERREQRKKAREAQRSPEQDRQALRRKVRMFYDLQRLRMQSGGRGKKKAEGAEIQLHEIDVAVLDDRSNSLLRAEKDALADIDDHLRSMAFYRKVFTNKKRWKGLGPTLTAVILAEFDIKREDTPSKMWAFAGLAPVPVQRCGRCHVPLKDDGSHVYERRGKPGDEEEEQPKKIVCPSPVNPYSSAKAMRPTKGEKLPYNAFLKMKLVGVLGPCLLKANSPWRKFYDDYKHRKASAGWGVSDGHRHNAAVRYMVKMLLLEIWREWRAHEGLEVRPSYQEGYLGHVHKMA